MSEVRQKQMASIDLLQSFELLSSPASALWHPQLRKTARKEQFHGHERTWQA
jgi:hypothetical protein